ncbi:MAG: helix-turn-helix domain-containing protein, partial [Planctomycetota bacterium]
DWLWEDPAAPQCRVLHLDADMRRQAEALCRELAVLLTEPDDCLRDALAWHRLAAFLLQILRQRRPPLGGDERIEVALRLLHADPTATWDVSGLAARVGLGRSRFSERFTYLVGSPPAHYAEALRLERACSLLLDGTLSIQDVASHLGYGDRRHFTRRFRARYGRTPRAWRGDR